MFKFMKITVLDGEPLNPGDLDWGMLRALAEGCDIHAHSAPAEVIERARGAEIVLTNKVILDAETLAALAATGLRYVGVLATGYNVVDLAAARALGVVVTNVPGYGPASVAQGAFALLLELTNRVGHHSDAVRDGRWSEPGADWSWWDFPLTELAGLTLGLIGFGQIGKTMARLGLAFGMRVVTLRRHHTPLDESSEFKLVRYVELDALFRESDVVSLHCPLSDQTRGLINRERLATMKRGALLINTSRGGLVVESDLAEALRSGLIAGAGLDVLNAEPPSPDNPLLSLPNCLITPHNSWATLASRGRLLDIAVANVAAFLSGRSKNVVS